MSGEYVFGYWDIRGMAAPIRMAFIVGGIKFREDLYSLTKKESGEGYNSIWFEKYSELEKEGKIGFPNIPYLILPEGQTVVQSMAILRHVGRIGNLYGDSDIDKLRIDEVIDQVTDLRSEMSGVCYGDFEGQKVVFATKSLPYFFSGFTKYLELSKSEFMGTSRVSIADLNCADALATASKVFGDVTSKDFAAEYPVLSAYVKRVFALPQLAEYVSGPSNAMPANNKIAMWGNAPRRCDT